MTRTHGALILAALATTAAAALLLEQPAPETFALEVPLELPLEILPAQPAPPIAAPSLEKKALEIGRRGTVIATLRKHGVPPATAHEMIAALRAGGANLRRVRPGDELELALDAEGRVVMLAYEPSAWLRFEATEDAGEWRAERIEIEPEVRIEARRGKVRQSLWDAVDGGAVTPAVLLDLVQMLESEFDFNVDVRPGDRFRLLVERRYAEGEPVDYGRILAAQYESDGRLITGVGFEAAERFSYYDLEGRSLKKTFLRSPLKFRRISSGFTYRRPHPILGGVRPHLAIDYAAPTGTPVWAVADGVVQFAGRNRGNGIQVVLRHRSGYKTYYNHLSRVARGVRRGKHVDQKQVIGYVGSTRLSTGPHLDYRVSKNGRFVNPLSERFMPGKPLAEKHRAEFTTYARALVGRLEKEAPFPL